MNDKCSFSGFPRINLTVHVNVVQRSQNTNSVSMPNDNPSTCDYISVADGGQLSRILARAEDAVQRDWVRERMIAAILSNAQPLPSIQIHWMCQRGLAKLTVGGHVERYSGMFVQGIESKMFERS